MTDGFVSGLREVFEWWSRWELIGFVGLVAMLILLIAPTVGFGFLHLARGRLGLRTKMRTMVRELEIALGRGAVGIDNDIRTEILEFDINEQSGKSSYTDRVAKSVSLIGSACCSGRSLKRYAATEAGELVESLVMNARDENLLHVDWAIRGFREAVEPLSVQLSAVDEVDRLRRIHVHLGARISELERASRETGTIRGPDERAGGTGGGQAGGSTSTASGRFGKQAIVEVSDGGEADSEVGTRSDRSARSTDPDARGI